MCAELRTHLCFALTALPLLLLKRRAQTSAGVFGQRGIDLLHIVEAFLDFRLAQPRLRLFFLPFGQPFAEAPLLKIEDEQDLLRDRLRTSRNEGLFTPPSLQGSISMPGHNGGANWASSAVDPVNGEVMSCRRTCP